MPSTVAQTGPGAAKKQIRKNYNCHNFKKIIKTVLVTVKLLVMQTNFILVIKKALLKDYSLVR